MNKGLSAIWIALVWSLTAWAVDLRTTVPDVHVKGSCEQAGIMVFTVSGDDFPQTPVYIRLRLSHGAQLCKTLVWLNTNNPEPKTQSPIYLPLRLCRAMTGDQLAAPGHAVSIVRWVKGEPEIWLKVETPTSQWIRNGNAFVLPDETRQVCWTLGLTARQSWVENNLDFANGTANLPAATRTLQIQGEADAVSTLICVDLSEGTLEPIPAPAEDSLLTLDPITFDFTPPPPPAISVENALDFGSITPGTMLPTSFSGDNGIGRGIEFPCGGELTGGAAAQTAELCPTPSGGPVCLTNSIEAEIDCPVWGFHQDSVVRLSLDPAGPDGIPVLTDLGNNPIPSPHDPDLVAADTSLLNLAPANATAYGLANSLFQTPDGTWLAREAEIHLDDPGGTGPAPIDLTVTVCRSPLAAPGPVNVTVDILASNRNRDQVSDTAPFDGPCQEQFCDASLLPAFSFDWEFGSFLPCDRFCCFDYNDGTTQGWAGMNARVQSSTTHPNIPAGTEGPGGPGDAFLGARDRSNQTWVFVEACAGNWLEQLQDGCGLLCWDVQLFEDGEADHRLIRPNIGITTASGLAALFRANFQISEPDGPNPGWHHVCAPISPLLNGNLPANGNGSWQMLVGQASDWNTLLANVDEVRFFIDFNGTQSETWGFDNVCLHDTACSCMEITNRDVTCALDDSDDFIYSFDVTNFSGIPARYLLVPPAPTLPAGSPARLGPQVIDLLAQDGKLLAHGETTRVSIVIEGGVSGEELCFRLSLNQENFAECCSTQVCITLPECECLQIHDIQTEVICSGDGTVAVSLEFTLDNLLGEDIFHTFLVPESHEIQFGDAYFDLTVLNGGAPVPAGGSVTLATTVYGVDPIPIRPGQTLCFQVTAHNQMLDTCCAVRVCIALPREITVINGMID